jgi:hypothetical protein
MSGWRIFKKDKKESLTVKLSFFALFLQILATTPVMAQAPVIGQGGAAPAPPWVARGSHAFSGGPTPTFNAACGSVEVAITGSDTAGAIHLGRDYDPAAPAGCLITFVQPWALIIVGQGPPVEGFALVSCTVSFSRKQPPAAWSITVDDKTIEISGGSPSITDSPSVVMWQCIGTQIP